MAKLSNKDYAIALYDVTKELKGAELLKMIKIFAEFLFRKGVAKQADAIINEYIKYNKKQSGIIDIEISSARHLTPKTVAQIKDVFGDKVESNEKIDESLLGGIKIKTENMIFDGSLRKQLQLLKQNIN